MVKKLYLSPAIRVRSLEMERLLDGGSITNINDGSGDGENPGPGYGGGGGGPAYAPRWGNLWDDSDDSEFWEM